MIEAGLLRLQRKLIGLSEREGLR